MQLQIEVAALVVLLTVAAIGTSSAESPENDGSSTGDAAILEALGIKNADVPGAAHNVDISWRGSNRFSVQVVGESETEPRGLFKVTWDRRQVAEFELLGMTSEYCEAIDTATPCYLVASASEHDELKAPLGTWHVTNEDVPDIYTELPSVGDSVFISSDILRAASQP